MEKRCTTCNIKKDLSEFHKSKISNDGHCWTCKSCKRLKGKEYRSRDYVISKNRIWYQENKSTLRDRTRKHYWTLNGQFHQYKKRAIKSGILFELTEKDCIPYYGTTCHYCGDHISGIGIDRLNNDKGYVKGNIVPCCSTCNFMKHRLNYNQFKTQIMKIKNHLKLEEKLDEPRQTTVAVDRGGLEEKPPFVRNVEERAKRMVSNYGYGKLNKGIDERPLDFK